MVSKTKLTAKQEAFCGEYCVDFNGKQAAIRAGYGEKSAEAHASKMLKLTKVKRHIKKLTAQMAKRVEVSADWVIQMLVENVHRSMQTVPVLDRWGNPTGVFKYEGGVANKGLELIGRHLGMFDDTGRGGNNGDSSENLLARLLAASEQKATSNIVDDTTIQIELNKS